MDRILFRAVEKRDYAALEDMICRCFGLHRYIPDPALLRPVLKQYLQSCLAEQTYTRVAQRDGKVIGVIMGAARGDYRPVAHAKAVTLLGWYSLAASVRALIGKGTLKDYHRVHRVYNALLQKRTDTFDGVLTLFAVSEDCRGLGVGNALLDGLLDYLSRRQARHIYLFTDSTCTYDFYERHGFQRLEEERLPIASPGEQGPAFMDIYLYGYDLPYP